MRAYQLKTPPAQRRTLDFEVTIQAFVGAVKVNLGAVVREMSLELRRRIMGKNPVDTGRSRDSWEVATGEPSKYLPPFPWGRIRNWPPPPPESDIGKAIDGTKVVFVTSNVDYVQNLEMGTSAQAPFGFIHLAARSVVAEMDNITRRALAGEKFR